jgi:acetylglutamate synthase
MDTVSIILGKENRLHAPPRFDDRIGARTSLPLLLAKGWCEPLLESRRKTASGEGRFITSEGFEGLDKARIKGLLEDSFGKRLAEGYLESPVCRVILEKDYLGIAIMKKVAGFDYLDKLAVAKEAQGQGIGRGLWECIKKDHGSFIWRASAGNEANEWYLRNSDGAVRAGGWIVYWCGIGHRIASSLADLVAELPHTMLR